MLGIAFALLLGEWRLLCSLRARSWLAWRCWSLGGVLLALLLQPPMKVTDFGELRSTLLASLAIGAAAGLATTGQRGLASASGVAAASQLSLVPAWLGYSIIHGLDSAGLQPSPIDRLLVVPLSLACLIGAAMLAYASVRMRGSGLRRYLHRVSAGSAGAWMRAGAAS